MMAVASGATAAWSGRLDDRGGDLRHVWEGFALPPMAFDPTLLTQYQPQPSARDGNRERLRRASAPAPVARRNRVEARPLPEGRVIQEAISERYGTAVARPVLVDPGLPIEYTPAALSAGARGLVIVRCVIETNGRVRRCLVVQGVQHMTDVVVASLTSRVYQPVSIGGRPVAVERTFKVMLSVAAPPAAEAEAEPADEPERVPPWRADPYWSPKAPGTG
jgi:hypothetical protein